MQHKCKVTVLRKELYPDLQEQYLADPKSGPCPFYEVGQEFLFERYGKKDDFWREGNGTQCSEAWDCISRYIYTALQGGSIMRGWTNDEKIMIACCNDGTRPVIFKIERIDYKVLYIKGIRTREDREKIVAALKKPKAVQDAFFNREEGFAEVVLKKDIPDELLHALVGECGNYTISRID